MSNWNYKDIYKKYNMIGKIELTNNSFVEVCDWTKAMPDFMKSADTLFIDPPWNMGNANTFYYKAGIDYPGLEFIAFSEKLFERIGQILPKYLFIEMGKEFLSWYLEKCKKRFKYVTFYNSTYYHKKENKCYVIHATDDFKNRRYKELEDLDEEQIIQWICANHKYECIGDLCMGLGLVGKHAYLSGKRFVGTELNPKRLAVLVDFIQKAEASR